MIISWRTDASKSTPQQCKPLVGKPLDQSVQTFKEGLGKGQCRHPSARVKDEDGKGLLFRTITKEPVCLGRCGLELSQCVLNNTRSVPVGKETFEYMQTSTNKYRFQSS